MDRWVTWVRLASSVWLQPNTALPALTSAANCRSVDDPRLLGFGMARLFQKQNPGGVSRRGLHCGTSISRSRSWIEVVLDARDARPNMGVPDRHYVGDRDSDG